MSADSFHSELEPLAATVESSNGFGPHDEDAAAGQGAESEPAVAATAEADHTSPDFLARLAEAMRETFASSEYQAGLKKLGNEQFTLSPAEAAAFIKTEMDKWSAVAKSAGIQVD